MMKNPRMGLLALVAMGAMLLVGTAVEAAVLYDMEGPPPLDGFFGLGATVTADTIGATNGPTSLKADVGGGGFVGVRTETLIPPALGNPPGIQSILFDLTIADGDEFTGSFADIGVTLFGHALNRDPQLFGLQAQFADFVSVGSLAAGTYTDMQIDLDSATNPITFANQSFDEMFGPGTDQLTVVSAFQLFISKDAAAPITLYIDNIRTVVPEPATASLLGLCSIFGLAVRRRK